MMAEKWTVRPGPGKQAFIKQLQLNKEQPDKVIGFEHFERPVKTGNNRDRKRKI